MVNILNRVKCSTILLSLLFTSGFASAESVIEQDMSPTLTVQFEDQSNIQANKFLEETFKAFIDRDKSHLKSMISESFVQKFGDDKNTHDEFIQHASVLTEQLTRMDIVFEDVNVDADGTVSEIHTVEVTKNDGSRAKFKLYAFYYFDHMGTVKLIDELSIQIEGAVEDQDMGSRTR